MGSRSAKPPARPGRAGWRHAAARWPAPRLRRSQAVGGDNQLIAHFRTWPQPTGPIWVQPLAERRRRRAQALDVLGFAASHDHQPALARRRPRRQTGRVHQRAPHLGQALGERSGGGGSMLEKSTTSVSALSWAARPSANITCSTAAVSDRHRHTMSASASQLGQGGGVAPAACSRAVLAGCGSRRSAGGEAARRRHYWQAIRPMPAKVIRRGGSWGLAHNGAAPVTGRRHQSKSSKVQTIGAISGQSGLGSTKKVAQRLRISSTSRVCRR